MECTPEVVRGFYNQCESDSPLSCLTPGAYSSLPLKDDHGNPNLSTKHEGEYIETGRNTIYMITAFENVEEEEIRFPAEVGPFGCK